jgi:hypothetical protein
MTGYTPPLADLEFVLEHVTDLDAVAKLNGFQHADRDTVAGVLAEAGPVLHRGDRPHQSARATSRARSSSTGPCEPRRASRRRTTRTSTPDGRGSTSRRSGVAAACRCWSAWASTRCSRANLAMSLCTMLTQASIDALMEHGSPEQQAIYLEKLVTGQWSGTMCLTEPHAGSDVGALTSRRRRPQDDGTYRISGQKIFITWGDQDLTENMIHLVLARTPGAAPGTKGISLFLVPKYLPDATGRPAHATRYEIVSLEHKLGIHASPTCVVEFDGASGSSSARNSRACATCSR